jgi:hypothetical protein
MMIEEVQEITGFYSTFLSRQAGLMTLLRAVAMPCVSFLDMTAKQAWEFAIPNSISHLWTSKTQDAFANAGGAFALVDKASNLLPPTIPLF